jgi:heme/copper-type cytochrome/quinol oxidase subunit 1
MNPLYKKSYRIVFLAIPIILLLGILCSNLALDINVHDTYYVIGYFDIAIVLSLSMGMIGIALWVIQKVKR